ncbi:hypothetical protein TNCV_1810271 [Trichonephila clavipes]|nr:hypothetical protein TNCV_1810271 [Trichonephila clavipes]
MHRLEVAWNGLPVSVIQAQFDALPNQATNLMGFGFVHNDFVYSLLTQRENILGVVRGHPPLFPFHQPHEWLDAARWLFKVPPCREGTMHLQTSMSSPGFEPSPNDTAVSVANHYTKWAT